MECILYPVLYPLLVDIERKEKIKNIFFLVYNNKMENRKSSLYHFNIHITYYTTAHCSVDTTRHTPIII